MIVVTTFENDDYVYDALRAGASGLPAQAGPAGGDRRRRSGRWRAGESLLFPAAVRDLAPRGGSAAGDAPGRAPA